MVSDSRLRISRFSRGRLGPPISESLIISAPAEAIYELVADVSRMGEWSPEATGARGVSGPLHVGDRFTGTNRRGQVGWFTFNTVRIATPGQAFEFDTDFGPLPISRWRYDFGTRADGTTRVTETWWDRRNGLLGLPIRAVGQLLIPGDRATHNRKNIRTTLQRLRDVAEGQHD
ncbi:MAG: SRPBCC family protein [Actinomycetia bacterium]|nr:SRPBCC family protein [Actinomycetes bacterium]MCH9800353.1 SRPBCC family protein [Actinomycetes bacterium]